MRLSSVGQVVALLLTSGVSSTPESTFVSKRGFLPLPPSLDPFYRSPADFRSSPAGTVLKSRKVSIATLGILPLADVTSYQLLYRTNGVHEDSPMTTVTTVIQPKSGGKGVLASYQVAEDSNNKICAPSYVLQAGSLQANLIIISEANNINLLLRQGWTVVIPDYEGPDSAFGAGRLGAHAVLDSMHAALSYAPLGFSDSTKIVGWGYSGGAIATAWAASLQPNYAPSLSSRVVGWAHGGTPANISETLQFLDGTFVAGFGFAGIVGTAAAYPAASQFLDTAITSTGRAAMALARAQCGASDVVSFAFEKFQSTKYQSFGDQILHQPALKDALDDNVLGTNSSETPGAPLFVYHAVHDEMIPITGSDTMVSRYCANGIKSLTYSRDVGLAEHLSAELLYTPSAIKFLLDRVNNVPAQAGCKTTDTTTVEIISSSLGSASRPVLQNLQDLLKSGGIDDSGFKDGVSRV